MAVTKVIMGNVSSLSVGGSVVEAANQFQCSRSKDNRPIYAFNSDGPVVMVSSKSPGTGSFAYTASDGTYSDADVDWSTRITGTTSIVCSGTSQPTGETQVITLGNCMAAGQSISFNAQNEMVVNVNFTFTSGTF